MKKDEDDADDQLIEIIASSDKQLKLGKKLL